MSFPIIPTVYPPDDYLIDGDDCACNCDDAGEAGLPRRIRLTISNGRLFVTIDDSSDSISLADFQGSIAHGDLEGLVPALPLGDKHYHLTKAQYDKLNALANTVALRGWTAIMETLEEDGISLVRFRQWIGGDGNPPPNPVPSYWGADGWTDKATATNFRGDKGDKGDKGDQGDRGEQGIQGQGGNNGWTPLYQHEEVLGKYTLRFYQWANGSGNVPALPSLPYLGANGAFVSAKEATDYRGVPGEQGVQGPRGRGYQIDKKGSTLDDRAQYDTQPEDFTWMDLSTGMVYFKITDSPGDWSEAYPFLGFKGWSPLLANVYDGERIVQRVIGWTGGQGDPPNYTYYIGAGGPVETPDLALEIRGPQGLQGDKGDPGDQGQQGIQGEQGQAGADGLSSYTYWAYCTNPEAADPGFSYLPGSTRPYIASITTTQTFNPIQLEFNQFANWVHYHGQRGLGTLAPVETLTDLAAKDTSDEAIWPNNWLITVGQQNAIYRFDRDDVSAADGINIIMPTAGPGRFIKTSATNQGPSAEDIMATAVGDASPAAGPFSGADSLRLTIRKLVNRVTNLFFGTTSSTTPGAAWRNGNTLRYADQAGAERLVLNAQDNLANLSDPAAARTNLGLGTASGDLGGSYPNPTVLNSAVLSKVLNGLGALTGNPAATDSLIVFAGKVLNLFNTLEDRVRATLATGLDGNLPGEPVAGDSFIQVQGKLLRKINTHTHTTAQIDAAAQTVLTDVNSASQSRTLDLSGRQHTDFRITADQTFTFSITGAAAGRFATITLKKATANSIAVWGPTGSYGENDMSLNNGAAPMNISGPAGSRHKIALHVTMDGATMVYDWNIGRSYT